MSLLTQQEIDDISSQIPGFIWTEGAMHETGVLPEESRTFARAVEAAVIRKLATVSVEPEMYLWEHKNGDCEATLCSNTGPHPNYDVTPIYFQEALAAARVQLGERAAQICGSAYRGDLAKEIRALIGGKE